MSDNQAAQARYGSAEEYVSIPPEQQTMEDVDASVVEDSGCGSLLTCVVCCPCNAISACVAAVESTHCTTACCCCLQSAGRIAVLAAECMMVCCG